MTCPECGADTRAGDRHCPQCGAPLLQRVRRDDDTRTTTGPPREDTSPSVASLVLGIVSLPMSCLCGLFAFPIGGLAIIMGVLGMNKGGRGMAIAGIVTGAVSIVAWIVLMVFGVGMALLDQQNAPR